MNEAEAADVRTVLAGIVNPGAQKPGEVAAAAVRLATASSLGRPPHAEVLAEIDRYVRTMASAGQARGIELGSGVSAADGSAFVSIVWGGERGQLSPAQARVHALGVLQCAEIAEQDALVMAELTEGVGLPRFQAAHFLVSLRSRRSVLQVTDFVAGEGDR